MLCFYANKTVYYCQQRLLNTEYNYWFLLFKENSLFHFRTWFSLLVRQLPLFLIIFQLTVTMAEIKGSSAQWGCKILIFSLFFLKELTVAFPSPQPEWETMSISCRSFHFSHNLSAIWLLSITEIVHLAQEILIPGHRDGNFTSCGTFSKIIVAKDDYWNSHQSFPAQVSIPEYKQANNERAPFKASSWLC